ncbi:AMPN Aminopeptidase, partial [Oreotrochilus melanogaster]|nr:AMPN Aminopeptidase [Oreotrochilus melanogaster]
MAAGFFISKSVGIVAIMLGLGAVATIIALSVVYAQEKDKHSHPSTDDTTTAAPPPTTAAPNNPWNRWRLPATLVPEYYQVTLQPFLTPDPSGTYIFKGNSSVVFICVEDTDLILIHSNKLNYTMQASFHASLEGVDGSAAPPIKTTWLETPTQYLVVQLEGPLRKGQRYRLVSIFTGELADDLAGFYRSEYVDGSASSLGGSRELSVGHPESSTPPDPPAPLTCGTTLPAGCTSQQEIDGQSWNITEFQRTPRMSTYLLAFIVSQFQSVHRTSGDVQIRIWGRPEAIAQGQGDYALSVTGPILNFYEGLYDEKFPLPKSDQVGLPDFNAGAMENWGLVTYRENSLLFDPSYSSIGNKERVVTVISHELAHQWFGNLVTLRWWNDLWLNEGFASYVEYLGADSAEPSWNIKDLMVLNEVHLVMATDALSTSHPLSFREEEINTPAQISEVFDSIAYSKVGRGVPGPGGGCRVPLGSLTLCLHREPRCCGWSLTSSMRQSSRMGCRWGSASAGGHQALVQGSVLGQGALWVSCTMTLDYKSYKEHRETAYMPWQAALNNLNYFQLMFDRSEVFGVMTRYMQKQVTPLFNHYKNITNNWQNISGGLMDQYNQINTISTACSYRVPDCLQLAASYFRQWQQDASKNPIPQNLRSAIYCSIVVTGGEEAWDFLWARFKEAKVVSEADKLRTALSCSPHPWILNRYLQYSLDPTKIRKQDATSTINSIVGNVVGQPLVWDFIRANWRTLFSQYGGGSFSFSRLILSITQRFSTQFELEQLEQFKKDNQDIGFGSGTRALEQALERTRANIVWVKENQEKVLTWF